MNKASKITLLAASAVLIVGGIGAAIYAIATESDKTKAPQTESTETTILHDDVEIFYNDDGNVKSERYYEDNKEDALIMYIQFEYEAPEDEEDEEEDSTGEEVTKA